MWKNFLKTGYHLSLLMGRAVAQQHLSVLGKLKCGVWLLTLFHRQLLPSLEIRENCCTTCKNIGNKTIGNSTIEQRETYTPAIQSDDRHSSAAGTRSTSGGMDAAMTDTCIENLGDRSKQKYCCLDFEGLCIFR